MNGTDMTYLMETEIKVRGYHADFYGHVNNARFLEFLEENRWALFESSVGMGRWGEKGWSFFVVNISINYRKQVRPGQTVVVGVKLKKIGTKSAVLSQEVRFKGTGVLAADAEITFVVADASGKSMPLTGELRNEIESLGLRN